MAQVTIRDLPVGTDPADVDEFVYNDDGVDRRITKEALEDSLDVSNSSTTTSTGSQTVAGALDDRVIKRQNVAAAVATNANIGAVIETNTYAGAGGGNRYEVVAGGTGTDDGGSFIDMANGNQLKGLFPSGVVNIRQFGADGTDDTQAVVAATAFLSSGDVLDLGGLSVQIVHTGVNTNPIYGSELNRTSYFLVEDKDQIKIQNGKIVASVDMTNNSICMATFLGCRDVTFDNVELNLSLSGTPLFSVNGFETYASLIEFQHSDARTARNLTIKSNCRLRINHPDGASVGPQDGNPVHNYSGKLVGIDFFGDIAVDRPDRGDQFLYGLTVESGAEFFECSARNIWGWMHGRIDIGDVKFIDCGTVSGPAHSMIRMLHGGYGIRIGNPVIENSVVSSSTSHWILSNNGGPFHPRDIVTGDWTFNGCQGSDFWSIGDAQNADIGKCIINGGSVDNWAVALFNGSASDMKSVTLAGIEQIDFSDQLLRLNVADGDEITVNGLKGDGGGSASNAYTVTHSTGAPTLNHVYLTGYSNGVFGNAGCGPIKMNHFDCSGNTGAGIGYASGGLADSEYFDGVVNENQGSFGLRLSARAIAKKITAIGNYGQGVQMAEDSIIQDYYIDDGVNTLVTSSGIKNETGQDGQIAKSGILKSTQGNFEYGIDLNVVATIVHNSFIGTVGTVAKWRTFGGSTVVGNTPNDTP